MKRLSPKEFEEQRKAKRPRLRQATLQSLKGVINVKRVLVLNEIMQCKHTSDRQLIDCLSEIETGQSLPVQILTETGIGRVIGPMRKHANHEVASIAKKLIDAWKVKIQQMPIAPVASNKVGEKKFSLLLQTKGSDDDIRKRAVDLFKSNILEETANERAKIMERDIYVQNDMKIDKNYKLKVRQKVFELKRNNPSTSKT